MFAACTAAPDESAPDVEITESPGLIPRTAGADHTAEDVIPVRKALP